MIFCNCTQFEALFDYLPLFFDGTILQKEGQNDRMTLFSFNLWRHRIVHQNRETELAI